MSDDPVVRRIVERLPLELVTPGEPPWVARHLPEDFWTAREVLELVRQSAHSRQRSGDAVLHATLARVAAVIPHTIKLPPIVGADAPLCYFIVLLGRPGVGKGSAQNIAGDLIPSGEIALGSGEGIVEALFDLVKEPDPETGKLVNVKRQVNFNALISVDEGDALAVLGNRSGSTLLSTLRTIWSGNILGQSNASQERRRIVPKGQYTYGVVMGLQESKAGLLLDDVAAGTPQRFCWALATDPTIGDTPPARPSWLGWQAPSPGLLDQHEDRGGHFTRHYMDVATSIESEIRATDADVARGFGSLDPYQAHANLLRLKVAGLLALLEGRMDVTEEDWELAGVVKDTSDAVRRYAQDVVAEDERLREEQTSKRLARRQVSGTAAVEGWRTIECAKRISDKVVAEPGITARDVQSALRRWRDEFADGLDHALAEKWVVERLEPGQGEAKRALYPSDGAT